MYESQLITRINLLEKQNGSHAQIEQGIPQIEKTTAGEQALLRVIDVSVQELNQPMRAILCWSKLLLSETEPDSPLAADLGIIVEEANRMHEIIRGLNLLAS